MYLTGLDASLGLLYREEIVKGPHNSRAVMVLNSPDPVVASGALDDIDGIALCPLRWGLDFDQVCVELT